MRKCLKDPSCTFPPNLKLGHRCKVGGRTKEFAESIMQETKMRVTTRAGGAGGGACNKMAGEVVWPSTGECVTLLTQGPCPRGEWVKLRKSNFTPVCVPQPCTVPNTPGGIGAGVMVGGKCYLPSQLPQTMLPCPPSQQAITNEHGELECDCRPGYVFYEGDKTCYKPFTRGPCAPGYVLKVEDTDSRGRARCFPNPCPQDNMVRMDTSCHVEKAGHTPENRNAHCFPIGSQGPCDAGTITVDSNFVEPICLTTHSIFSNAVVSCARGSRRDLFGRCRSTFDSILSSVDPIRSTRPVRGRCPAGSYFAGGTCIRIRG